MVIKGEAQSLRSVIGKAKPLVRRSLGHRNQGEGSIVDVSSASGRGAEDQTAAQVLMGPGSGSKVDRQQDT